jgi:hypothetical protein
LRIRELAGFCLRSGGISVKVWRSRP